MPDLLHIPSTMTMSSESDIHEFVNTYRTLLIKERNEEIERTSLLLSNCGPKLLELKGLALAGLSVVEMNIGLGGKTYGHINFCLAAGINVVSSLVLWSWSAR